MHMHEIICDIVVAGDGFCKDEREAQTMAGGSF